ncbi:phosphodiester glycosidase family protein [Luteolibacter sp. SL250]|uniref:phosphodiester glycosidase family protein n=1 Tax=Luteolibacter sp. SL250 TaxID=2995170 RepID=UPI0022722D58|nr:phosphodiester glycosidase family protein [Luteolibacter sp. SL250]WAC21547.1 phosphodiester glycosidase family protein [Luteolibacter sp. SL250]
MKTRGSEWTLMASLAAWLLITEAGAQTTLTQPLVGQFGDAGNIVGSASAVPGNDLASFNTAMSAAFGASAGGVFDFPSTTAITANTTVLRGTTASKDFQVTFSRGMQAFNNGATYTASSGTRGTTTNSTPGDYSMSFGPVRGVPGGETLESNFVSGVGFVAMSRTNAAADGNVFPLDLRATATFSDGSTEVVTSGLSGTRGENVFFGFTAPSGLAVQGIQLEAFQSGTTVPVSARIGLDDIGLIISETPFRFTVITPENSYLLPGADFIFGVESPVEIHAGNVTLMLDGQDATSRLSFGGTPQAREISITGLTPGNDHEAIVTIDAGGNTLVRTYRFTTREPAPEIAAVTRNGSYLHPAAHFEFTVRPYPGLSIAPADVTLSLNGTPANGRLSFGGTPGNLEASISGLVPHQSYHATITSSSAHGLSTTRTYHFHTLGTPLALSDTGGFTDNSIYPTGDFQPTTHGSSIWQPQVGANQALIINTGEPGYEKVLRRPQGGGARADYLYFPPLADGVLKVAFDARVSEAGHRTLDIAVMPDSTNNTLMAGFLQFGLTPNKISYFDNTNYYAIDDSNLDTEWHHYELIHHYSGPNARTYDLYIDGTLTGWRIPWRNGFDGPLARLRIQTIAVPGGASPGVVDIDNIVITASPLEVTPIAAPVTTTQLGQGVVYKKFTHSNLFSSKQNVFVTEINLNDPSPRLAFPHANGSLRTVPQFAGTVSGAVAAINGQFFNGSGSIQYFKAGGTLINPTDNAQDQQAVTDDGLGTPNSVRMVQKPGDGWESLDDANIMSTGPWLFRDGVRWTDYDPGDTDFASVRHPRTAAAWTYDNRLLLIAVDGRTSASAGMTIPELQTYIDSLGWIKYATNYDGGGSTTLWSNAGGGTVMNVPASDPLRPVANAIAVTAAPVASPATPASVAAVEGEAQVSLYWQLSSGATSYEIRRAESVDGPYEAIANPANTWFTDTNITPGSRYFYIIIAKNSAGESIGTAPLGTGAPDGAPLVPSVAISITSGTVNLTFGTESGRSYQLQRSTDLKPSGWDNIGDPVPGTGSPILLQDASADPAAFYRIFID